jgi:cytidylate kinase
VTPASRSADQSAIQPVNEPVTEVAQRVLAAPARLGPVRLVVVDGPAGSGKTTYAAALAAALGDAPVVHMDDLFGGWAGALVPDVWRRLEAQVLAPLRNGATARYQMFDWDADEFGGWIDVAAHGMLVLEGVGSAALPVDPWAVLRVWVEVPPDLRLARGVTRDGLAMRGHWLRFQETEDAHFASDGTRDRADVIVDGTA